MDQLLQCPICLDSQTDPRILPCLHSLCQRCLEKYVTTSGKQGSFPCPVCRAVCQIPLGGVKNIPKNFFLNNVKDILAAEAGAASVRGRDEAAGRRCANWGDEETHGSPDYYCRDCAEYLCQHCREAHKRVRQLKAHRFLRASDVSADEAERAAATAEAPRCDEHPHNVIDIFCDDCQIPTCSSCSILSHVGHKHTSLKQAADGCDQKLDTLAQRVEKYLNHLEQAERKLKATQDRCHQDIKRARREIDTNADYFCNLIRQKQKGLQQEMDKIKGDAGPKMAACQKELELHKANVLSIKSYIESLKKSKHYYTKSVHTPGIEQQLSQQEGRTLQTVDWEGDLQVKMKTAMSLVDMLGSVTVSSKESTLSATAQRDTAETVATSLKPVHIAKTTYSSKYVASGLVASGDHIYVTYNDDSNLWVCSKKGQFITKCPVKGMKNPTGMVLLKKADGDTSSNINLAITDYRTSQLFFIEVSPSHAVVSHRVCQLQYQLAKISVDPQGQLIIADPHGKCLHIHDRAGRQIRSIQLSRQLDWVYHAIATDQGYVVVDSRNNSVVWVDSAGHTLHTYGTQQHEELNTPMFVLQDGENRLVVCDIYNHRLHLIGPDRRLIQYLVTSTKEYEVSRPSCVYLDESAGLLYMAHGGGGTEQVAVYKYPVSSSSPQPCKTTTTHLKMLCTINKLSA